MRNETLLKCLDSRPDVHRQTELQHRIQNIENKHKYTLQKAKEREIKYNNSNNNNDNNNNFQKYTDLKEEKFDVILTVHRR